ncbi:MAG: tetratricopeptide repeat protein [Armatimonadetes bacterium]|nr:tetratricopeptide repeat protein [Armatimonadota bacterium]
MRPYPDSYEEEQGGWRERLYFFRMGATDTLREIGAALWTLISPQHWAERARAAWYWWGLPTTPEEWSPERLLSEWRDRQAERRAELLAHRMEQAEEGRRISPAAVASVLVVLGFCGWVLAVMNLRTDERVPTAVQALKPRLPAGAARTGTQGAIAHATLGRKMLEGNRLAEAAREFSTSLTWDPNNLDARLGLAKLAVRAEEANHALDLAKQVVKDRPKDPDALNTLAVAQAELGKPKEAEKSFQKALAADPEDSGILMNAAAARSLVKDWKGAEAYARRAAAAAPRDPAPLILLALLQFEQNRPDEGARYLEEALTRAPRDPVAHQLLGRIRMAQKRWADAQKHLRVVQELQPDTPMAFVDAGHVALATGNLDGAELEFRKAIRLSKSASAAWLGLAAVAEQRNDRSSAIEAYEKALDIQPNQPVVQNNLAYHYADSGQNLDRALALAREAVRVQPLDAGAWDTLGWVSHKKGSPAEAVRQLTEATRLRPDRPVYHYHLGKALLGNEQRSEGVKALEKALELGLGGADAEDARNLVRTHSG